MTDKFDDIINQLENDEQPVISIPEKSQNQEGLQSINEGFDISKYSNNQKTFDIDINKKNNK